MKSAHLLLVNEEMDFLMPFFTFVVSRKAVERVDVASLRVDYVNPPGTNVNSTTIGVCAHDFKVRIVDKNENVLPCRESVTMERAKEVISRIKDTEILFL